jgi:hypothetical protein
MRRLLLAMVLAVVPVIAGAQHSRVRVGLPGFPAPISIDSLASIVEIEAPRGKTFAAAEAVLKELKIAVDTRDSVQGVIGNSRLVQMRRLAGKPMSRFLNCGSGMTGQYADEWRIHIALFAIVEAKGPDKTILRTGFVAGAQDIQGASKDPVQCGTTGMFELDFAERVKKRVLLP